jgi:diguanylate cyclase (GGDEF)-like protein
MTTNGWSLPRIGGLAAAAFLSLPLPPLPVPTPSLLPAVHIPSASLPPLIATPPLPAIDAAPANQLPATSGAVQSGSAGAPERASQPAATRVPQSGGPSRGIGIPFTAIFVSSPLDVALLAALATLPLLFGIWLLLFGRTLREARRARDAQVRLMVAAELGLRPRDLSSMTTRALFELREKSAFDELTGVLRRAAGISVAEREIARSRRHNSPLSVAFIDIDGLKEANDRRGHAAGDKMLRGLTRALTEGLRAEDVVFRYGGDEFVCVLPDTEARQARLKLSEIQAEAARAGVRFCAGVAQLARSDDVVSLFARADKDLYDFKANRGEIVQLPAHGKKAGGKRTVTA